MFEVCSVEQFKKLYNERRFSKIQNIAQTKYKYYKNEIYTRHFQRHFYRNISVEETERCYVQIVTSFAQNQRFHRFHRVNVTYSDQRCAYNLTIKFVGRLVFARNSLHYTHPYTGSRRERQA